MIVDGHTKMYSSNGPLNKLHVPIGIHLASIQFKNIYTIFRLIQQKVAFAAYTSSHKARNWVFSI